MPITRLSGGLTPADGSDPRTFPAVYDEVVDAVEAAETDITAVEGRVTVLETAGFRFAGQRIYESSGLFAKADPLGTGDIGLRAIRVRVVGAGGGGGGAANTTSSNFAAACGGGGGGVAEKFITNIAGLSASESIGVGLAGTGGSSGANSGSTGGTSTAFGMSAGGGFGGLAGPALTAPSAPQDTPGGVASGGDLNSGGLPGGTGIALRDATGHNRGGSGGSAPGFGGSATAAFDNTVPPNSTSPGAGGPGAGNRGQEAKPGGNGAPGLVIVDCFV